MNNRVSFLSSILHSIFGEIYVCIDKYKIKIVVIGTCLMAIILGLSYVFYSSIINYFLRLVTGYSLTFVVYVIAWWMVIDFKVEVKKTESVYSIEKVEKPKTYKLTIIWGITIVILGIMAMHYSNKYRKHYALLCETFLVDCNSKVYHLEDSDCEGLQDAENVKEMKGYEIGKGYIFCEECKEYSDEMEDMVYERR